MYSFLNLNIYVSICLLLLGYTSMIKVNCKDSYGNPILANIETIIFIIIIYINFVFFKVYIQICICNKYMFQKSIATYCNLYHLIIYHCHRQSLLN